MKIYKRENGVAICVNIDANNLIEIKRGSSIDEIKKIVIDCVNGCCVEDEIPIVLGILKAAVRDMLYGGED